MSDYEDTDDLGGYDFDYEPDIDFRFEHDSAMESIGWGDDDAYGPVGGDSDLWGEM